MAIISDMEEPAAVVLAEQIGQQLEAHDWAALGCDVPLSASIGCAVGAGADLADLITRADQRLFEAKDEGRNRVVARPVS